MKRADVVSVRALLSGSARFRTPASHRSFVWSPQQVAQLLVDLEFGARDLQDEDEYDASERFYLGVITVSRGPRGVFFLHDGHQRLTTLSLILAFIRDRIDHNRIAQKLDRMLVRRSFGRPPEPRLRLTPEDHAWYSHFILPPGATARLPQEAPLGSPRELLLAARFMEESFRGYSDDELWNLALFATQHTAMVRSLDSGLGAPHRLPLSRQLAAPAPAPAADPLAAHYRVAAE